MTMYPLEGGPGSGDIAQDSLDITFDSVLLPLLVWRRVFVGALVGLIERVRLVGAEGGCVVCVRGR